MKFMIGLISELVVYQLSDTVFFACQEFKLMEREVLPAVFLRKTNHPACYFLFPVFRTNIHFCDLGPVIVIAEGLFQLNTDKSRQLTFLIIYDNDFLMIVQKTVPDIVFPWDVCAIELKTPENNKTKVVSIIDK